MKNSICCSFITPESNFNRKESVAFQLMTFIASPFRNTNNSPQKLESERLSKNKPFTSLVCLFFCFCLKQHCCLLKLNQGTTAHHSCLSFYQFDTELEIGQSPPWGNLHFICLPCLFLFTDVGHQNKSRGDQNELPLAITVIKVFQENKQLHGFRLKQ